MKQLIFLLSATLMMGCGEEQQLGDYERITPGTYVLSYKPIESVSAYADGDNALWLYENPAPPTSGCSRNHRPDEFKALSEKHGDRSFPHDIMVGLGGTQLEFFAQDFSSIEITSDQDFDDAHPAGSSLKDIVRIYTVSPYDYVKSGYTETFDWQKFELSELFRRYWGLFTLEDTFEMHHVTYGCNKLFPIDYLLSELPEKSLTLLGRGEITDENRRTPLEDPPFAVLRFERKPEKKQVHRLSITFTDDDGKAIQSQPVQLTW